MSLWTLRLRHPSRGVITELIDATNPDKANAVGQAYCDSIPMCRFISVDKAVVADESILPQAKTKVA